MYDTKNIFYVWSHVTIAPLEHISSVISNNKACRLFYNQSLL